MRAFTIAVIAIAGFHCYVSLSKGESPLNWQFLLLVLSPLLALVWKDIGLLKFGHKGFEIERIKEDVNRAITKVTHGHTIDSKSIETLFKSVELNDWLTLVLARMLMRKGLVLLHPDHGLGPSPSLDKLIKLAAEHDTISEQELEELERLRDVTFYAEWWGGRAPIRSDWKWALQNAKSVIERLFDKQKLS